MPVDDESEGVRYAEDGYLTLVDAPEEGMLTYKDMYKICWSHEKPGYINTQFFTDDGEGVSGSIAGGRIMWAQVHRDIQSLLPKELQQEAYRSSVEVIAGQNMYLNLVESRKHPVRALFCTMEFSLLLVLIAWTIRQVPQGIHPSIETNLFGKIMMLDFRCSVMFDTNKVITASQACKVNCATTVMCNS